MTLHQLRIFECVARHLNITRASDELHMSQPAVSQQLRLLQEEYGVTFLLRISHGIALTDNGRAFLYDIKPILGAIAHIEKKFTITQHENTDEVLRVGGSHSMSVAVLPEILAIFKKAHPKVGLVLETNQSKMIERRIVNSELDIAVITSPSYSSLIACEPYEQFRLVAFAAPTSPMVGKALTAAELARGPLVVRKGSIILEELVGRGYHPNVAANCEAAEAVKAAVQKGMGVGILHWRFVEHEIQSGLLKKIDVPELHKQFEVRSFIIYAKRKPLSAAAQDLLKLLRETAVSRTQSVRKKARVGALTLSR